MILNENDSGRTVKIGIDEVITVRLIENPTTGYRWLVESLGGLEQISDRFESDEAIGASGVREFHFRATKVGLYQLNIKNWREWEGGSSIITRFVVNFNVD